MTAFSRNASRKASVQNWRSGPLLSPSPIAAQAHIQSCSRTSPSSPSARGARSILLRCRERYCCSFGLYANRFGRQDVRFCDRRKEDDSRLRGWWGVGIVNVVPSPDYPSWCYYPTSDRPAQWVIDVIQVVAAAQADIDSAKAAHLTSDNVLAFLRPGLEGLGYHVESGKTRLQKIRRPVLFGEQGQERVAYEVDAVHDELGVLIEVEAGRGARGNAVYRDLVRTSLIVDARFLAIGVMATYRHMSGGSEMEVASYRETKAQLEAIYASGRLRLPFEGVLLFGY